MAPLHATMSQEWRGQSSSTLTKMSVENKEYEMVKGIK